MDVAHLEWPWISDRAIRAGVETGCPCPFQKGRTDILYILPLGLLGVPPRCPAEESPEDTSFLDGKYPWMAPVNTEMIPSPTWDRDGPPHL